MAFREADLAVLFADMGEKITFGALSATGLIDERDEVTFDEIGHGVQHRVTVVTLAAPDFAALVPGDTVRFRSTNYKVRSIDRIGDGATKEVTVVT